MAQYKISCMRIRRNSFIGWMGAYAQKIDFSENKNASRQVGDLLGCSLLCGLLLCGAEGLLDGFEAHVEAFDRVGQRSYRDVVDAGFAIGAQRVERYAAR